MTVRSQEVTLIRVDSPFDVETTLDVKEHLTPALSRPNHLVIDLRGAEIDCSGLGAILSMQRQLELRDRRLALVVNDPDVDALLERTGVRHFLALFPDTEQAVQHVLRSAEAESPLALAA